MTWLRWVLVLPAAVVAYFAVQLLTLPIGGIAGFKSVQMILSSILSPAAFILAGAFTAPRRRFLTGLLLAIVGGLMMVWILLSIAGDGPGAVWRTVVTGVAFWLVISALACWPLWRLERNRRPAEVEADPYTHFTQNTQN